MAKILSKLPEQGSDSKVLSIKNSILGVKNIESSDNSLYRNDGGKGLTYLDSNNKKCFTGSVELKYTEAPLGYSNSTIQLKVQYSENVYRSNVSHHSSLSINRNSFSGYNNNNYNTKDILNKDTYIEELVRQGLNPDNFYVYRIELKQKNASFDYIKTGNYPNGQVYVLDSTFENGTKLSPANGSRIKLNFNKETQSYVVTVAVEHSNYPQFRIQSALTEIIGTVYKGTRPGDDLVYIGGGVSMSTNITSSPMIETYNKYYYQALGFITEGVYRGNSTEETDYFYYEMQNSSDFRSVAKVFIANIPMKVTGLNGYKVYLLNYTKGTYASKELYSSTSIRQEGISLDINTGDLFLIGDRTLYSYSNYGYGNINIEPKVDFIPVSMMRAGGFIPDIKLTPELIGSNANGSIFNISGCNTDYLVSPISTSRTEKRSDGRYRNLTYTFNSEGVNIKGENKTISYKKSIDINIEIMSGPGGG